MSINSRNGPDGRPYYVIWIEQLEQIKRELVKSQKTIEVFLDCTEFLHQISSQTAQNIDYNLSINNDEGIPGQLFLNDFIGLIDKTIKEEQRLEKENFLGYLRKRLVGKYIQCIVRSSQDCDRVVKLVNIQPE